MVVFYYSTFLGIGYTQIIHKDDMLTAQNRINQFTLSLQRMWTEMRFGDTMPQSNMSISCQCASCTTTSFVFWKRYSIAASFHCYKVVRWLSAICWLKSEESFLWKFKIYNVSIIWFYFYAFLLICGFTKWGMIRRKWLWQ